jgi:malonyl CoA-acyl carrier protein transacylase
MLACMFPGQGSQFAGMGRELFPRYPELCALADATLGYSIEEVCAGTDTARLNSTAYTQPAIFFVSCLAYIDRRDAGRPEPALLLGHSLGLYAGLFAAGVFDLATGLRIVSRRGELMANINGGAMTAVIGDIARLPAILVEREFHDVDVANFNTPAQAVISGKAERVAALGSTLEGLDFSCIKLPVSGPFHSRYMEPARLKFMSYLQGETLLAPAAPVVSTTSAQSLDAGHLVEELGFQITKPVRWMQTVRALRSRYDAIRFEEVGPGRVLTKLNTHILPQH